jgi:predicted lipoprotein with Yx(FWY)xxD motif
MTLYYFAKDSVGNSTAGTNVLVNWPIFNPIEFIVPSSLNTADFGRITRQDGKKQATFRGWPLYYFANDHATGDTLGQGVNDVWFVINPDTFMIQPAKATAPAPIQKTSP